MRSLILSGSLTLCLVPTLHAQWTGLGAGGTGTDISDPANYLPNPPELGWLDAIAESVQLDALDDFTTGIFGMSVAPALPGTRVVIGDGVGPVTIELSGNFRTARYLGASVQAYSPVTFGSEIGFNTGFLTREINNVAYGSGGVNTNGVLTIHGTITGFGGMTMNSTQSYATLGSLANTYEGPTTVTAGTLKVFSIGSGGIASGIGASTSDAANLVLNGGRLQYRGAGDTTDRLFSVTAANSTFDSSGTGPIVFTNIGAIEYGALDTARNLNLVGYNTGDNILSSSINNNGSTAVTLAKSGPGKWILRPGASGNAFSGTVSINDGTLVMDYSNGDFPASNGIILRNGGRLTLKGASAGTTDALGSVQMGLSSLVRIALEPNPANPSTWTASSLALNNQGIGGAVGSIVIETPSGATFGTASALPSGADGSAANAIRTVNGLVMAVGGAGTNNYRSSVFVRDSGGLGYAVQNPATLSLERYNGYGPGDTLSDTLSSTTGHFKMDSDVVRSANLNFSTLWIDAADAPRTLDLGSFNMQTSANNGRSILVTGDNDVTITSGTGLIQNSIFFHNFGTGKMTINVGASVAMVAVGTGLIDYSKPNLPLDTYALGAVFRISQDMAYTGGIVRISSGGIFEVGGDLNGAAAGDFTRTLGTGGGNVLLHGSSGFSAYTPVAGGARTVTLNGGAALRWGTGHFLTNNDGSSDGDHLFKLGSPYSNATVDFTNGVDLNTKDRVIEVADGVNANDVDARLSGVITGAEVGFTKTGPGTLDLSGTNSYSGLTRVAEGRLLITGSISGGVEVLSGAELGGNGSINTGGADVLLRAGARLAPGASPGVLTLSTGAGLLDISGAASGTGAFKFELGIDSSRVLLASGTLAIGSGILNLDDFSVTDSGGFGPGTYTLFSTSNPILGSLGFNLTGDVLGFPSTLGFSPGGQDIVLTVIPEPGSASCFIAAACLLGLRRRTSTRPRPNTRVS